MAPQVLLLKGLVLPLGIFLENQVKLLIGVNCLHLLADGNVCYIEPEEMLLAVWCFLLADQLDASVDMGMFLGKS